MPWSSILNHYPLSDVVSVSKITTGLINETYKIEAGSGAFILQKLNPIFVPESIYDVDTVSQYLKSHGVLVQEIIRTHEGKLWVEENSEIWRLMTYIPGEIYERIKNSDMAYAAGKILGQFHRALADFKYEFRHHRPMHHNIVRHFELLEKSLKNRRRVTTVGATRDLTSDYKEINGLKKIILELPKLLLPKNLRQAVTHGDPKVSNIVFGLIEAEPPSFARSRSLQSASRLGLYKAIALVDLDDVGNHHSPLVELGDAFRSWCSSYEDDPDNSFDLEKFSAAFAGYNDGSKDFLATEEKKLIPQAIKLITLELASRFLRDYFEDSYFGWNPEKYKSRRDHNLARAKGQVALYNDIVKKERKIIQQCYLS